ncbi:putative Ig domain-containing protein [Terrabacter sp. NPDC080008]|uniref:putative Ig domain-containing protein n=1 Tax=Terrabacter sp. NPDC080008 TaxID=3155176 RepID=UPI00344E0267
MLSFHARAPRAARVAVSAMALVGAVALAASTSAGAAGAPSTAGAAASGHRPAPNPYSPQSGHHYRHGVVPTQETNARMKRWAQTQATTATGTQTLSYGGAVDGIGVTSGKPRVYLVFWGTQWGTQGTDANGNLTFSSDTAGGAPKLQQMFKGLGTGNELWSGVMTQYCDGPGVATGATSCGSGTAHVGYPTGGALAGVWYDNSASEPSAATGTQLGTEAVRAASHFGNTTAASNRYAQYVVLSAKGLNPDSYKTGGFCAWHDWNGDVSVASSVGDVAFTNMPYVMDQGTSCGQSFVNAGSAGTTDGYTMVEGHEYAETVTDQNPAGGWTNHTGDATYNGQENADECAWISPGSAGGAGNVAMGNGSYPMQATWSNDTNGCDLSHPVVGGTSSNTVTVTNPGNQSGTVGTAKSLQIQATDSASGQSLTYSASSLPTGLSINSSTGLVSGTPSAAGTFSVTVSAKDTTNASGSTTFTWTIGASGTSCSGQLLGNPGFETGTATPWSTSTGVVDSSTSEPAHSGSWKAWLDGYGTTHTDTLSQSVSIPAGCKATLTFYVHIDTAESGSTAYDKLAVKAGSTTLTTLSNANASSGYVQKSFDLSSFAGQTVTIGFTGTEDSSLATSFVVDDTAVTLG